MAGTTRREVTEVLGPWSLATSRRFWEGFGPNALAVTSDVPLLRTTFLVDTDWSVATAEVQQDGRSAVVEVTGAGDLEAAAVQVRRFLSLDVDAREWPAVGDRDPVVARAQSELPGLRPCGFHSPYEAAVWAVLSQRVKVSQAAALRRELARRHGERGVVPAPAVLARADLDLPGRKAEYLRAVAAAALDGVLDGASLRQMAPEEALAQVQQVTGIGPFGAELVVLRGANAPDAAPHHEARLADEVHRLYGPDAVVDTVAESWRPFRTWAAVHLRVLRERRTHEMGGRGDRQ